MTLDIIFRSIYIAIFSLFWGSLFGLPLGFYLALSKVRFKRLLLLFLYILFALPPISIGLFIYLLFSRSGVFGFLGWLFTPKVMIIAQSIMVIPLITTIIYNSLQEVGEKIWETSLLMGASYSQILRTILKEIRFNIGIALSTAFGRVVSEVGASTIVGGDIEGKTRTITTAILTETRKGNFDFALEQALILILISLIINSLILLWQGKIK
ncbi:MAG: ABC transporter permease [Dictyoglomaceae bacterium]